MKTNIAIILIFVLVILVSMSIVYFMTQRPAEIAPEAEILSESDVVKKASDVNADLTIVSKTLDDALNSLG